jgi:hypothetical protein
MAYENLPVPDGFDPKISFFKWHGEFWVIPEKGKETIKHLIPPSGGKFSDVIQPTSNGVVRVLCYLDYRLTVLGRSKSSSLVEFDEADRYQFGCDWPYSFSERKLAFGPYQRFTVPASQKTRILQGGHSIIQIWGAEQLCIYRIAIELCRDTW